MHQNLNGDPIPTEKTLVRVDLGDGRTGVEVYTMDLREVRDAEAKVLELYKSALSKEAEKRVRMILESTPLCCHFWDEKINIIDCNLESLELFEFSNKQEYLDRFFELSPEYQPDGKPSDKKAREAIKTAFDTGYITFEWMHRKLDGGFIPAKVTLIRVELGDGHKGIAAYVQDLREEKAAEARIRDAEKRARIILDATPLCTQLWDANQNMIDCNLEALKLYGFKDKQEYIDRFFELSPEYQPDGSLSMKKIREIHKIVLNREYMVFEWMHKKIDGELIPSKITAIRVELGDGSKGIAAYVRDLREEKAAEAKIKEAEKRAQIMLDATPLCTQLWDENQNVVDCNLEGIKLYGFQNKQEYIDNFFELSPEYQPDGSLSKEKAREQVKAALDKGRIVFEWTHRKLNGELIPAEITLVRVELANGHIGVAGYTRDLREAKAAEAKIKEGNERNKIMFDAMPLSCSLWDENMKGIDCNDEVLKLLGLSNKEEFLCYLFDFFPEYQPDGRQSKEKAFEMLKLTLSKGRAAFEWMYRTLNGDPVPCDTTLIRVRRNSKNIIAVYMRDLREVKEQSAKLDQVAKLAYSDPLTGAYNRRYFMQYANLHVQNDVLSSMGIIMLDLDHFKKVNDTYGHEAGDQALKLVSAATQSVLRESDLFARFGGEEFIVLAQNIDLDNLTKLAFRICREIENINFFYNETKIPITISAGVAMRGSREQSLNEVIGQADNALYQAKSNGRNRVEVYVNQANKNLRGAT
jgi:diguanylate cyclase (GGDEF)-like protein